MKPESILAKQVSDYLSIKYPDTIFQFSIGADVKLSKFQASKMHRVNGRWRKGFVDLVIYERKHGYGGLMIELKADGRSPFKKNGELKSDEHLKNQQGMHRQLSSRGYKALFCTGFDEARKTIDEYLNET